MKKKMLVIGGAGISVLVASWFLVKYAPKGSTPMPNVSVAELKDFIAEEMRRGPNTALDTIVSANPELTFNVNPDSLNIELHIESTDGQIIKALVNGLQYKGRLQVNWDGTNEIGERMPPGLYLAVLTVGDPTGKEKPSTKRKAIKLLES